MKWNMERLGAERLGAERQIRRLLLESSQRCWVGLKGKRQGEWMHEAVQR